MIRDAPSPLPMRDAAFGPEWCPASDGLCQGEIGGVVSESSDSRALLERYRTLCSIMSDGAENARKLGSYWPIARRGDRRDVSSWDARRHAARFGLMT
jgi:hypothetical protein